MAPFRKRELSSELASETDGFLSPAKPNKLMYRKERTRQEKPSVSRLA